MQRRIERGGERFWRHTDFPDLPPAAVNMALSRFARQGLLERVRKGLYYRGRKTALGPSLPAASAMAAASIHAPLHPAGLTAANLLGFSTQNPARPEYATPANDPPGGLGSAIVHTRRPPNRAKLSQEDGALLELLRDRAKSSDLDPKETKRRLLRLLRRDGTFERLARAAADEPPRVRAMLGALGEELGADQRLLDRLRTSLNPLTKFDFGVLRDLRYAAKWQAR